MSDLIDPEQFSSKTDADAFSGNLLSSGFCVVNGIVLVHHVGG